LRDFFGPAEPELADDPARVGTAPSGMPRQPTGYQPRRAETSRPDETRRELD
jgi:hypothetical protein